MGQMETERVNVAVTVHSSRGCTHNSAWWCWMMCKKFVLPRCRWSLRAVVAASVVMHWHGVWSRPHLSLSAGCWTLLCSSSLHLHSAPRFKTQDSSAFARLMTAMALHYTTSTLSSMHNSFTTDCLNILKDYGFAHRSSNVHRGRGCLDQVYVQCHSILSIWTLHRINSHLKTRLDSN